MIPGVYAKTRYCLGIDPGKTNLGWALVSEWTYEDGSNERKLVYSETINAGPLLNLGTINHIFGKIEELITDPCYITDVRIERYVAYNNVLTKDAERIIMLIGALDIECMKYTSCAATGNLVRAIDWKRKLVQQLHIKHGFHNPSDSLDKEFSIAAAQACLPDAKFKTDHEADAICLACLPLIIT
jgi:hypothetical protein